MKKKWIAFFRDKSRYYLCPILLGTAVCYAVLYDLYRDLCIPYSLLFFGISPFLFRFFDKLKSKKTLGGIIYTVILIVFLFISRFLIAMGTFQLRNYNGFRDWFYGAEGFNYHQPLFLNAFFLSGSFFLISILYYFTQVQYRTLGVMLCILFPFIIYAKRADTLPETFIMIIVVLYLATIVHNQRISQYKNTTILHINRSYIISIGVFIALTFAVTMTIERPNYLAQLQRNPEFFDYNPNRNAVTSSKTLENIQSQSDERYGTRNYNGNILFYFDTDGNQNVYYLRRQSFTFFDGNVWILDNDVNTRRMFYSAEFPEYKNSDVISDSQSFFAFKEPAADLPLLSLQNGKVYAQSFAPKYLPAPFGMVVDNAVSFERHKFTKSYPDNIVYRPANWNNRYSYSMLNDTFIFYQQNSALYEYAHSLALNNDDYFNALVNGNSPEAERLLSDYINAQSYYLNTENISQRLAQLAEKITSPYPSDIDKALSLEQYFEKNNYIYDEDYTPDDTSIDYFVFESKTGVCTSYATAMTLMARSVGLPSRYVEGFAVFEKTENNTFVIRDKHAHAFVEIYIPAVGWMTFDPTVSAYRQLDDDDDGDGIFDKIVQPLYRYRYILAILLLMIFLFKSDRFFERLFRIRQIFGTPKQKTLRLYAHLITLINFSANGNYNSYTVNMLRKYLDDTRGVVPEELLQLFERTAFGGHQPDLQEYHTAYKSYKKCYRFLRKIPRKKPLKKAS